MTLILEGSDLTGKSTLARTLGWDIVRKGSKRGKKNTVESTCKMPEGRKIWGRCWLTEEVYGRQLRNSTGFDTVQLWEMGMHYESVGAVMLFLSLNHITLERRFEQRGDPELDLMQIIGISDTYIDLVSQHATMLPPVFKNSLIHALFEHEKRLERVKELKKYGHSGWGGLFPKILFVVSDEIAFQPFKYPYSTQENAGGAAFFTALHAAGLGPRDIRVVSNYVIDDWHATRALIGAKSVVALGAENYGLSHYHTVEHLPHPNTLTTPQGIQDYSDKIRKIYNDCTGTPIPSTIRTKSKTNRGCRNH